ncbi:MULTISPECIES: glycosyltransferase family 2 protein [unclassified Novosphingobium]|uniref:glycosyltransferase family 2 protein n=1 Tax=unclassified Novosphingobium TaxID=2644732 RepID=UPI0014944C61|nr:MULTISPECIES: glycosyltransferase [unclassified Novosphingobium]MBB3356863.1 glycosyltransferase involved in cell wall biosynthesis [Novosphingobium sp. BK256]MBB3373264.1 glycosyltransferase involved in cell wall biosynthesis [Novosphingobium sp. BK280]MBB3377633.1 glycosyltransferase involved in cell wall biosynthesis [Novosphingobium sp. BK258]MBB3418956.1 glycosyltransferase involved in cell wall biosynthesis [Novosphingobium sp. BK267]MBB3450209.1 glycosyltransferase involved in cell w
MLRIHVAIATVGRASLARQTIDLLAGQSRQPDGVIVVGAAQADLAGVADSPLTPELAVAERGLCRQRNRALDLLAGRTDVVIFFDDDFVPAPDYLAAVERLFLAHPDVAGITGNLVGDGVRHGGYGIAQAQAMIAAQTLLLDPAIIPREALYGCNMALRMAHVGNLRFDEALPLYGWQEDIDFTMRLSRHGRLVSTGLVSGVHLGVKGGRTSGRRLGYSQVANIVYLRRKGTMPGPLGRKLLWRNVLANLLRAPFPEPHVDRWGRLRGNALALADLWRGRIDPRKIESM